MSAIQTLPTEKESWDEMRTVFRLSLNATVDVLSTFIIAWFVVESTYANFDDLATPDVTKNASPFVRLSTKKIERSTKTVGG